MKLEAQVVSLDLAKKLKALNVKQESLNAWCRNANYGFRLIPHGIGLTLEQYVQAEKYSAFTVAELGEMLPCKTNFEKYLCNGLVGFCVIEFQSIKNMAIHDKNEANCRAKMLIYLIEQNVFNPAQVEVKDR